MTDDDTGDKRRLVYDGDALIAEYAPDGTLLGRYLHGPSGLDDPLVWYQDASVSSNKEHCRNATGQSWRTSRALLPKPC